MPGPAALTRYTFAAAAGREPKYLGHNPLGALMIVVLLVLLALQGTLGLFTVEHNDLTAGPLYLFLSETDRKIATSWHRYLFEAVTVWLIGVHIVANVFYAAVRREPLLTAMITGRKPTGTYADTSSADIIGRPLLRAGLLYLLSAVIVFGGIWLVGGKFLQMRLW